MAFVEFDQAVRLGKRQGTQQHRVHHAEHGRVGADAQRQREHRDGGESGAIEQHAERKAQIVHGVVKKSFNG